MNRHLQRGMLSLATVACYIGFVCLNVALADPTAGHKTCKGCVTVGGVTSYFEITCPEDHECCGFTNSGGNPDVYCRNPNLGPNHPEYREECLPIAFCNQPDPL